MDLELACGCSSHDLEYLSDEEIIALCDAVGADLGEEILKQGQREDAIARTLARDLSMTYETDLDDAISQVLNDIPEADFDIDRMPEVLESIGQQLEPPKELGMGEVLLGAASTLFLLSRRTARAATRAKGRSVRDVSADLTERDLDFAGRLSDVQLFWIGDMWSKHLSARVNATVAREALQRGLGREEVGQILRGVVNGEFPGARVPGTFAGSVRQYFTGLAGTVRTHGSSLGAIHAISDAGIATYEFNAVLDKRTSEICFASGTRVFTQAGHREIQDITPGDFVISGGGDKCKVLATNRRMSEEWLKITLKSGRSFMVTPNHPMLYDGGWIDAGLLKRGDRLARRISENKPDRVDRVESGSSVGRRVDGTFPVPFYLERAEGFEEIVSIEPISMTSPAFNIQVENDPTYVVENVIVHNCRFMHGRVFTVQSALSLEERMLRTVDPDEFKEVAGWKSAAQAERLAGGGDLESQSTLLSANGVQLPPLHGSCRSIVIPIF